MMPCSTVRRAMRDGKALVRAPHQGEGARNPLHGGSGVSTPLLQALANVLRFGFFVLGG